MLPAPQADVEMVTLGEYPAVTNNSSKLGRWVKTFGCKVRKIAMGAAIIVTLFFSKGKGIEKLTTKNPIAKAIHALVKQEEKRKANLPKGKQSPTAGC